MKLSKYLSLVIVLLAACDHIPESKKAEYFKEYQDSVVRVLHWEHQRGGGTGWAYESRSGHKYVVTNNHVCQGTKGPNNEVVLTAHDNKDIYVGKVLAMYPEFDLCLITGHEDFKILELEEEEQQFPYDVYVLGHPLLMNLKLIDGLAERISIVEIAAEMTQEECSTKGRWVEGRVLFWRVELCLVPFEAVETSLEIYSGNSGSPVFNNRGKIVGVVFAGDSETHFGFFIQIKHLHDLVAKHEAEHEDSE